MCSRGIAAKLALLAAGQAMQANAECAFRVGELFGTRHTNKRTENGETESESHAHLPDVMYC